MHWSVPPADHDIADLPAECYLPYFACVYYVVITVFSVGCVVHNYLSYSQLSPILHWLHAQPSHCSRLPLQPHPP